MGTCLTKHALSCVPLQWNYTWLISGVVVVSILSDQNVLSRITAAVGACFWLLLGFGVLLLLGSMVPPTEREMRERMAALSVLALALLWMNDPVGAQYMREAGIASLWAIFATILAVLRAVRLYYHHVAVWAVTIT